MNVVHHRHRSLPGAASYFLFWSLSPFLRNLRQVKMLQKRVLLKYHNISLNVPAVYTSDRSVSWSNNGNGKVTLYSTVWNQQHGLSLITERTSCRSSFHLQHPHFWFPNRPMIPINVFDPGSLQGRIRLSSYYQIDSVKKTFSTLRNDDTGFIRSETSALGKLTLSLNRAKNISKDGTAARKDSKASQPYEDLNLDMLMTSAFSRSLLDNANNVQNCTWKNTDESTCSSTFYNEVADYVRDIHGASQLKELDNNKRNQNNVILEKNTGRMHEENHKGSLLVKDEAKRKTEMSGIKAWTLCSRMQEAKIRQQQQKARGWKEVYQ